MNEPLQVRRAIAADLKEILTLFTITVETTCKTHYTPEQIAIWVSSGKDHGRWMNKINTQYFVIAELAGVLTGFGSLEKDHHIDVLYVHPDHQRRGVANRILSKLEHQAYRHGTRQLTSDVSLTARPFFEKQRFVVMKENRLMIKETEISNYRMGKVLSW